MSDTPTHEALRQCRDALTQLIACHDEPECPTLETGRAALAAADAALSVQAEPVSQIDSLALYKTLCDLVAETGAVDTVIGRPAVLRSRLAELRDKVGALTGPLYATQQPPAPVPAVPAHSVGAEGLAPSAEAAEAMGAKGAPATDAERIAFEAWMRGHCWALCATWTGTEYRSDAEQSGWPDPQAMATRRMWAAWRDRAALASRPAVDAWQPIETAPKDGTRILIDFGTKGVLQVAWQDRDGDGFAIWCVDDEKFGPYPLRGYIDKPDSPTRPRAWMPTPAARHPAQREGE